MSPSLNDLPITGYCVFYHAKDGKVETATFDTKRVADEWAEPLEENRPGSTLVVPVIANSVVVMPKPEPLIPPGKRAYLAAMNLIKSQGKGVDKEDVLDFLVEIYKDKSLPVDTRNIRIRSVLSTLSSTLDGL